jgi:uncharacterized protein YecE (DUF72 family)
MAKRTVQVDLFSSAPDDAAGTGQASDAVTPGTDARVKASRVQPATVAPDVAALATRIPPRIRMGTSSWSFPGWAGLVYGDARSETDLARHGLAAYAAHPLLGAVGIDRTFYAPIGKDAFAAYGRQVAAVRPDFRFLVKAPMLFTGPRLRDDAGRWSDNPAFLDPALATTQFIEPARAGLGAHCGPLVFQFPPLGPRFTRHPLAFADRLAEFLLALPPLDPAQPLAGYAIEVRDPELLTDDYLAALCAGGATHCAAIHARMPPLSGQVRFWREAGPHPLVIRWSLHSGLKYEEAKERYAPFDRLCDEDPIGRAAIADALLEATGLGRDAIVIVNNKAEGSAPLSIIKLAELVAQHGHTIISP